MASRGWMIGCGVVGAVGLLACGGVAALVVFGIRAAGPIIAAEQERQALATNWTSPVDGANAEDAFPAQVAGYARESTDEQAAIPELQISATGWHAVYRAGESHIDAYLYPMTAADANAAIDRVQHAYDAETSSNGTRSWSVVRLGSYARAYAQSGTLGQNHVWYTQDWLLVFRTRDTQDREEFVKAFLAATSDEGESTEMDAETTDPVPAEAPAESSSEAGVGY